jgi:hypothetical protein
MEFPGFIDDSKDLESADLDSLFKAVEKINQMTWAQVMATSSKGAGKRNQLGSSTGSKNRVRQNHSSPNRIYAVSSQD